MTISSKDAVCFVRCVVSVVVAILAVCSGATAADDLADVPMERLVIDDMEDVSDWYNGSPEETKLAASASHVKEGNLALEFANLVDHTKGEKNYPIGWPRSGKDLKKLGLTDWTDYEYFECWIYVTTSRDSLPKTPIGVGFYHSGPKRSTHFRLNEVRKDEWTKVEIPISRIELADDIKRVQFNISESDYAHGDQVNFYIDDVVLTRFAHPVIGSMTAQRRLVYAKEPRVAAEFELLGNQAGRKVNVVLEVGCGEQMLASTSRPGAELLGEIAVELDPARPLMRGGAWMKLHLEDDSGKRVHSREATFRVIEGPF